MNGICAKVMLSDGTTLEYRSDMIVVDSWGHNEPDESWSVTDVAGHEHHWAADGVHNLPTLDAVYVLGWCDRCNDHHDTGDIVDYYTCKLCNEAVSPGYRWARAGQVMLEGKRSITRTGWVSLTPEDVSQEFGRGLDRYAQVKISSTNGARGYLSDNLTPEEAEGLVERIGIMKPRSPRPPHAFSRIGRGGGGNDPGIPACKACGAYGGGGHGGGCPNG